MTRSEISGTGYLTRMTTDVEWRVLKVDPRVKTELERLRAAIKARQKATDFSTGFSAGETALFSGPSGTGKTLAANVLATSLGLNVYRIDLSKVMSKYIGETEKNLERMFNSAEAQGAVLLFDEADALFGRRTDVSDAHDRYANQEVSYLLQRIENFDGVVILTTNLKENIDPAFMRRFRHIIDFAS